MAAEGTKCEGEGRGGDVHRRQCAKMEDERQEDCGILILFLSSVTFLCI